MHIYIYRDRIQYSSPQLHFPIHLVNFQGLPLPEKESNDDRRHK